MFRKSVLIQPIITERILNGGEYDFINVSSSNLCVHDKLYDTLFGDLAPYIFASATCVNIIILSETDGRKYTTLSLCGSNDCWRRVMLW